MIECSPSGRFCGGLQLHVPSGETVVVAVIGSDWIVIVIWVPGGPSPKNSGVVVEIISFSSMLSSETVSGARLLVSSTSNPEF